MTLPFIAQCAWQSSSQPNYNNIGKDSNKILRKKGKSEMDEFKKFRISRATTRSMPFRTEHQVADRRDLQDSEPNFQLFKTRPVYFPLIKLYVMGFISSFGRTQCKVKTQVSMKEMQFQTGPQFSNLSQTLPLVTEMRTT